MYEGCSALAQVELYNGAASLEAIPVKERYTAAVACIAEGVLSKKPALIAAARRYLLSYQDAAPQLGYVNCFNLNMHKTCSVSRTCTRLYSMHLTCDEQMHATHN